MKIEKYYSGDYLCDYAYNSEDRIIKILLYYSIDSECSNQWPEDGELIEMSDRKIFVTEDSVSGEPWVSVYTETCNIGISEKDQLIEIGKRMTK